jgi:hypothetical protein
MSTTTCVCAHISSHMHADIYPAQPSLPRIRVLPCLAFACTPDVFIPITRGGGLFIERTLQSCSVCVFITAGPSTKMFTWGGGGIWEDMCYERRRAEACVWTSLPITHIVRVRVGGNNAGRNRNHSSLELTQKRGKKGAQNQEWSHRKWVGDE